MGKDTAIQIALGLIVLSIAGYSLALGFALEKIITKALKQADAIAFLNSILIYYFFSGIITRYFFQSLPTVNAQPYLHLPISRNQIANFLVSKSLVHVLNISVFLLFTPFAVNVVAAKYGTSQGWAWLLTLWLVSLINHFLVIIVKTNFSQSAWKLSAFIATVALLGFADYFGWIKLSFVSEKIFSVSLNGYRLIGLLLALVVLGYYLAKRSIINRLYQEGINDDKSSNLYRDWAFLQRFGLKGEWINLELKLIFRNKRSRELFLMHAVFLLLPLGFYSYAKHPDSYGSFLFFALISSGFFTMNYGQFLFSWQATHFDFTLMQPASIRQFVESKYWLLASSTIIWFLFSIPYVFIGWHFFLINLVASLFNIGVNTFIVMNMSMWGARKIDLKHSGSLNFEGIGAAQWLMGFPLMASPYLFYSPFYAMGYPILGLVAVGVAGLIGIALQKTSVDITTSRLINNRHFMAANFRQD